MGLAQSRKQRILGDVRRRRRQRAITSVAIVALLVVVIIVAVFLLPKTPPNAVQLPPYLDHCVIGTQLYHSHPSLKITINGQGITIPDTSTSSCGQPIHTHDTTGVLHIETDQDRDYDLGDWFLLWGHWANNANTAIFNSTQIFNNRVDTTHHLNMTVNGVANTEFQNLQLPRNAVSGQDSCTPVPAGGCQPFSIVITYG